MVGAQDCPPFVNRKLVFDETFGPQQCFVTIPSAAAKFQIKVWGAGGSLWGASGGAGGFAMAAFAYTPIQLQLQRGWTQSGYSGRESYARFSP
jgi:hypothetical protein